MSVTREVFQAFDSTFSFPTEHTWSWRSKACRSATLATIDAYQRTHLARLRDRSEFTVSFSVGNPRSHFKFLPSQKSRCQQRHQSKWLSLSRRRVSFEFHCPPRAAFACLKHIKLMFCEFHSRFIHALTSWWIIYRSISCQWYHDEGNSAGNCFPLESRERQHSRRTWATKQHIHGSRKGNDGLLLHRLAAQRVWRHVVR